MTDRYFYHSFPRRATPAESIIKGCQILSSIRESGLLLVPESIEWKQPSQNGEPRIFPVLQKRVCFTELSPSELAKHSETFGQFALEFEVATVRQLGAMPVFYVPQSTDEGHDGNALGVALLGAAMDASVVISRLAKLDEWFKSTNPAPDQVKFDVGFARNASARGSFTINTAEAKNVLEAVGHLTTPWGPLNMGTLALMNFFYPADDIKHDRLLDYYRQREWRIACPFAINGIEVLKAPSQNEKDQILKIDPSFFGKAISTDLGSVNTMDLLLVHPGMGDRKVIEMARRVIVPFEAVTRAKELLAGLSHPPAVVSPEDLAAETA